MVAQPQPQVARVEQVERLAAELACGHRRALIREVAALDQHPPAPERVAEVGREGRVAAERRDVLLIKVLRPTYCATTVALGPFAGVYKSPAAAITCGDRGSWLPPTSTYSLPSKN